MSAMNSKPNEIQAHLATLPMHLAERIIRLWALYIPSDFCSARLKAEMNFRTPKKAYLDFNKFSAFSKFLVLVDSNRSNWTRRADAVADC